VEITEQPGQPQSGADHADSPGAIPYELTPGCQASNTHNRAPLDVTLYVDVTGGHPAIGPVSTASIRTNGWPQRDGQLRAVYRPAVGEHILRAEIESTYGARASQAMQVTVVANQPPVCALEAEPRSGGKYYRLTAVCKDPDGQMVGYRWVVNGVLVGLSGATLSVTPVAGQALVVELTAVDDSEGRTTVTRTLP